MSLFSQIRESCKFEAESAALVKIRTERLADYLQLLLPCLRQKLEMDEVNHFSGNEELTVNYFIVLDCINFGSGYFADLHDENGPVGYFTIASKLKKAFEQHNGLNCSFLKQIDSNECFKIFALDPSNSSAQALMQLFAAALNQLGNHVEQKFAGSFTKLVNSAEKQAENLVAELSAMDFYLDRCFFRKKPVYFFKRAQITASDLNIALKGQGLGQFFDLDQLTIFADNLLPHVLWIDGIIEYDEQLAQHIRNRNLIEPDSDAEIELRATAVHTVELLRETAFKQGFNFSAQQFDYVLWNRGQAQNYRIISPHRTLSHFY